MFKETLRDVQSMYFDIGAFDKKYDEFKEIVLGVKDLTIFVLIRLKKR